MSCVRFLAYKVDIVLTAFGLNDVNKKKPLIQAVFSSRERNMEVMKD